MSDTDGWRRSQNEADAGRPTVHGRLSRTAPEYKTGFSRMGMGGGSLLPATPTRNPTCAVCGGRLRGTKPCTCEMPHDHWKPEGPARKMSDETLLRRFDEQRGLETLAPVHREDLATIYQGDCIEVMALMPENSVDAIVCDPPYGLEFMGKEWDKFRVDEMKTARWRGERAGDQGRLSPPDSKAAHGRVAYGGTRPKTSQCTVCGKRDAFRNPHPCGGDEVWTFECVDADAAPPSMLAFGEWCRLWAKQAIRVLKPGGYLLAFGGSRTYHRLACAVEDAGFDVRDQIMWIYGSGFPKSHDVSKAIDRQKGVDRAVVGFGPEKRTSSICMSDSGQNKVGSRKTFLGAPVSDEAQQWDGWGTALKPSHEPICMARKPLSERSVAANVLRWGTGAINIDGCRIASPDADLTMRQNQHSDTAGMGGLGGAGFDPHHSQDMYSPKGRWPANVVLIHSEGCEVVGKRRVPTGTAQKGNGSDPELAKDWLFGGLGDQPPGTPDAGYADKPRGTGGIWSGESNIPCGPQYGDGGGLETIDDWQCVEGCPVLMLDRQSRSPAPGTVVKHASSADHRGNDGAVFGAESRREGHVGVSHGDRGGASRFFYTGKANSEDRGKGKREPLIPQFKGTQHPTVKPLATMQWLIRMVTPPGGVVLDPFLGSGTTVAAARALGIQSIGIERDAQSVADSIARLQQRVFSFGLEDDGGTAG